jgi:hypothetical protein
MPDPGSTPIQPVSAHEIPAGVRHQLSTVSAGSPESLFAARRKVQKEVMDVLDGFEPVNGYTIENARLIQQACGSRLQAGMGNA